MLAACSASPSEGRPQIAPDPVIAQRVEIQRVCPAELRLALPPKPALPADAALSGNQAGMAWLRAMLIRLGLIEVRLADAARECL